MLQVSSRVRLRRQRRRAALLAGWLMLCASLQAGAQEAVGRVHVRHIQFENAQGISDGVLRREMQQLEGAVLDTLALGRSRLRLEALPYVAAARIGLRPVPGAPDQVDVVIEIEQAPARRYGAGGAWSESMRGSVHGYFINENLLGIGQRLAVEAELSEIRSSAQIAHTAPWVNAAGVSRTASLSARRIDALTTHTSAVRADFYDFTWQYGYRLAPAQTLRIGGAARDSRLGAGARASEQLVAWVAANGDPRSLDVHPATRFRELDFLLEWRHDTRDRAGFPRRGLEQTMGLRAALPESGVEYYALDYRVASHWPLGERWTATARGRLGYGAAYGGTTSLPPYLNWFAGGPETVRGFRENHLGPLDSRGNPYGGNALLAGQLELMTPWRWPERWQERVRVGFFYDFGNVFSTEDVPFEDSAGQPVSHRFALSRLRRSAGAAAHFRFGFGTLRLSYGVPLDARDRHPDPLRRDRTDRLQLALGVAFE